MTPVTCFHCHKPGPFAVLDRWENPIPPTCVGCGRVQPRYKPEDLPQGTWLEGGWQISARFYRNGELQAALRRETGDEVPTYAVSSIRMNKANRCRFCNSHGTLVADFEPEFCTNCQKVQREYTPEDLPVGTLLRSLRDPDVVGEVTNNWESHDGPTITISWPNGAYSDPWVAWVTNRKA